MLPYNVQDIIPTLNIGNMIQMAKKHGYDLLNSLYLITYEYIPYLSLLVRVKVKMKALLAQEQKPS